jgi:serine phosphatase RsbU (regulator of sigma subunit)
VCGKGPEAAAVTGLARHSLRTAALAERRPSAVLRVLNETMLSREEEQRFCTVAYARIRPGPRGVRVTLCSAGHPLPMVLRADGRVEPVGRPGALLGVFRDPELADVPFDLGPGDDLVLYTDGVTEERGPDGFFGVQRLRDVVTASAGLSADAVAGRIERAVLEFGSGSPRDDLTVLILRVGPG